jgi:hypothetical protein
MAHPRYATSVAFRFRCRPAPPCATEIADALVGPGPAPRITDALVRRRCCSGEARSRRCIRAFVSLAGRQSWDPRLRPAVVRCAAARRRAAHRLATARAERGAVRVGRPARRTRAHVRGDDLDPDSDGTRRRRGSGGTARPVPRCIWRRGVGRVRSRTVQRSRATRRDVQHEDVALLRSGRGRGGCRLSAPRRPAQSADRGGGGRQLWAMSDQPATSEGLRGGGPM